MRPVVGGSHKYTNTEIHKNLGEMAADQEYVPQQMTTSTTVVSNNTATDSGRKFKRSISWSDSESNLRKLRNGDFNNCDLLEKFLSKRRHCHLQFFGKSGADVDIDVNAETESVREDPPEFRLSSSSDADDEVSTRPSTETCPTEPMENKKQIKPGRKLLKTNSVFSDEVFMPDNKRSLTFQQKKILVGPLKDKLFVGLSGLYGIALVVLGFVLPIAETFSDPTKPYFFEIFYLYLYITSILFLIYVYVYLLRRNRMTFNILSRTWSFRRSVNSCKDSPNASTTSFRTRKRKVAFDETNNHHTGSFYLRLGALGNTCFVFLLILMCVGPS
ncbi:uncharacterized protein LOC126809686 [Patella vulgata]|uniref:uncharacterized protein LOC126809686 n=1 Tax=Patella vulgata TaxID=6465 RepID=UPI00218033BD|nr:uncharacterized protein LOC126809686 [Patella vulgata]